tara:strand:+ start:6803 stop:7213 length:411 start_codon:yes stop_codon:yes gene_type:complete
MSNKILIVGSKYYKDIYLNLLKGALVPIKNSNFEYEIREAPGSLEIPFIIKRHINNFNAFIALGCVIRGETYHFELISNECARKINDLSINNNKPIGFGILTCDTYDQALVRSDPLQKNKGEEAANACIDLLNNNS